jgi:hypothetical protein
MIYLDHPTRIAASLLACLMLFDAGHAHSQTISQKQINASYVWKPSQDAAQALKKALSNGNGTQEALLRIMRNAGASDESLSFAASFSEAAAYLSAIEPPNPGGFTVGTVTYPFRTAATKTYVILNGRPRMIDVTNREFLNGLDTTLSNAFTVLWGSAAKAECLWNEPRSYNIQPGMYRNAESNDVEVAYPIKNRGNGKVIGFAYVVFQFAGRGWEFSDTQLEMITDAANNYLWPNAASGGHR